MPPTHIVIRRIYVERGHIRYEPFGYADSLVGACELAKEYPSSAEVGDMLIVCDLAHVSSPEEKALYIYIAKGHGRVQEAKRVPTSLGSEDHQSNWFDVWGGRDSFPQDMYAYVKRSKPGAATAALRECAAAYNFIDDRLGYDGYWMGDLIDDLTTLRKASRKELTEMLPKIIADVIPLHKILLT